MTVNLAINDVLIFGGAGLTIGALFIVQPLFAAAYLGLLLMLFGVSRENGSRRG